jgi:hypothetical protein
MVPAPHGEDKGARSTVAKQPHGGSESEPFRVSRSESTS